MPFNRPPLLELIERVDAELATRLGLGALLRRSVLGAIARVLAGVSHQLHGHLDWIADQVFPDSADAEHLERWASIWGLQRKPGTYAAGSIVVSGTPATVVPAGTRWIRPSGEEYASTVEVLLVSGSGAVPLEAIEPGAAGNAAEGSVLTVQGVVAGLLAAATVAVGGLSGGAEAETDAALRERILARIQEPPMGGAAHDYVAWALAVPGITRAWVHPLWEGPATVRVIVVTDDAEDGPSPSSAKLLEVQEYIDERRPVTADVTVAAPVLVPLDLTIEVTPDTSAVRAAVIASLEDLLRREAEPGETLRISHIREAISAAPGEQDNVLHFPTIDVPTADPELLVLGEITWEA